ncbi:MAG: hypothetical protein WDM84_09420 [Bauldia sp.]
MRFAVTTWGRRDEAGKRAAQADQRGAHVVVGIEREDGRELRRLFLGDQGAEQRFLAVEIDVERALRDARLLGEVAHAGGIEAARQKHAAGSFQNLTALARILSCPGASRRGVRLSFW